MADGIVYVDAADGQKRVMNNAKLYRKLLTKFKDENNLKTLIAAVNAGDYEKAQTEAHTIKGIAANLSFPELYKQSVDVETHIKSNSVEPDDMETLSTCFTATLDAIEKVLANNA
jgi:HPt (histidine-containing phosphotransfer) domain-containing protein